MTAWRLVKRHALTAYAILAVCYLLLPIAVVILFSFNAPKGRFNYVWQGFTLDNWVNWDDVLGLRDSVVTSLQIGVLATLVATVLGTLIALAIVRHHFRGRGRRTSSCSCRCRRPRSCSAPRCSRSS